MPANNAKLANNNLPIRAIRAIRGPTVGSVLGHCQLAEQTSIASRAGIAMLSGMVSSSLCVMT
jgi:hypothetical protein